jgi:hypothetical protein
MSAGLEHRWDKRLATVDCAVEVYIHHSAKDVAGAIQSRAARRAGNTGVVGQQGRHAV